MTRIATAYFRSLLNASDPKEITDEIALNPLHFATRKPDAVLSTLVHEMVHLWQHHFGERPRKGYHDGQWAAKMREVGLIPTATCRATRQTDPLAT